MVQIHILSEFLTNLRDSDVDATCIFPRSAKMWSDPTATV